MKSEKEIRKRLKNIEDYIKIEEQEFFCKAKDEFYFGRKLLRWILNEEKVDNWDK